MLRCQWVLVWWSNCKPAIWTLTTKSVEHGMKRLQYYSTSRHSCTFCPLLNQWSSLTATVLYSTSRAPVTVTVTSHCTAHSTNYMRAPVYSTSALPGKFILPEWHIAFNISHMPKPIALPSQDRTWVFSHVWDEKTTNLGLGMFKCELPHGAQGEKRKKPHQHIN